MGRGYSGGMFGRPRVWAVLKTGVGTASLVLVFLLPGSAHAALTEPCGLATPSASGYFFTNYESVEYTPEGYLVLHFKNQSRFSDGRGFSVSWSFVNDQCVTQSGGSAGMGMPAGVTDWSIRFTSVNHFDLWDDTNNIVVSSIDITPSFPNYYRVSFRGSIDGGASFVNSRTFKIYQPGIPPEFPDTAEKSAACPDITANGYYFDSYEHAEYVDGLLRVHLRLKTPFNDGRTFRLSGLGAIEPCVFTVPSYLANPDANMTPRVRYYSFRMTSPTHWVMWDDENDVAFTCARCQGDIPAGSAHVLWYGTIDAGASTMRTTPFPPTISTCCSSVLFLPGLKGSKLVYGSDTLWPPSIGSFANDVGQLALNADGTSINDIKVDGVLEAFYTTPIYSGFTSYLDGLVAADTIKDWEPLPYDWRLSPVRIIEDGVELQSGMLNLADEVERLASESYSEKVMIVAHSYGGLVAKRLIAELESRGKSELVESLVLVGSPQLGTPQAAASMLHGAGESIGLGYIVNPVTSRQVALNMESAYHLLPSRLYFDRVAEPVITFDHSSSFTDEWRTFWGPGISNYVNFFGFVTGADVLRTDPDPQSLRIPEIVSPALLTNADAYHSTYDSYLYPPNINVVQIAGWGLPTVKSIDYRTEHFLQSYRTKTTIEGDNTVVYPSAVNLGGASHYFNLDLYNDLPGLPEYQHRDLLNAAPTQAVVQSILTEGLVYPTIYITNTKPEPTNVADKLMVSTFSPVILGAYDLHGRFTGVDPSQDLNSDLLSIKQEIPGSYFLEDGDSYSIYLPSTGEYSFVVKGLDSGPASIEVSTFSEASTTLAALFKDFAVSDTFTGTFTVDTATPREVQLTADTDGDGETDVVQDSDLKKKPLTVLARNKSMTLEANVPDLNVELVGFVSTDTVANSVTGVASCTTTAVSISPVGAYPITCTLGTLESSKYEFVEFIDGVLTIGYGFSGFLKPINDTASNPSVFKAGSTVPVKFQILNAEGVSVQSATAPEWLNPVKGDPLTSPRNEKKRKRKPSNGEVYQWKPKAEHYQYNWDTKGYEPGYWYEVSAKLDDGTIKSVMIGLK